MTLFLLKLESTFWHCALTRNYDENNDAYCATARVILGGGEKSTLMYVITYIRHGPGVQGGNSPKINCASMRLFFLHECLCNFGALGGMAVVLRELGWVHTEIGTHS